MKSSSLARILVLVGAIHFVSVHDAECTQWRAGPFGNDPLQNGANQPVVSTLSWYPEGGLGVATLVIAGYFDFIDGVAADGIAVRDPFTLEWEPLGDGPGFDVQALAVHEGDLIAAGGFLGASGGRVSRWTGTEWQILGVFDETVRSLCVYDGQLVAGGWFTSVGGQSAPAIAAWNGTTWQSPGGGMSEPGYSRVLAMTLYDGDLIAGGVFASAGGQPASGLARWNGSTWQAVATDLDGSPAGINALAVYNGELIAGGYFEGINGVALANIGRWNGSIWRPLGSGISGCGVSCLTYNAGMLVAGGTFQSAGGVLGTAQIARWNGSSWQSMDGGIGSYTCEVGGDAVLGVTDYAGELIAVGSFFSAGGDPARHIARWNGSQWTSFGGGSATIVRAFTRLGSRLIAGGSFDQPTSTGFRAFNIVGYNGAYLDNLSAGMNDWVIALEAYTYPVSGDDELVAGGAFTTAGEVSANRIARWLERDVGFPPAWEPMGAGFNDAVYAIERFNDTYYAAGAFTSSGGATVNRIARWNEATDTWEPLGTGTNGPVYALKVRGGYLYVGGVFSTAGGLSTGGLARWNGSAWSQLGDARVDAFFEGSVYALEVHGGSLYAGGQHTELASSPNIVRWGTTGFSGVSGGANSIVYSLASSGAYLYAGGDFSTVGGVSALRCARWNGSWENLGGADQSVRALAIFNGQVHVGGLFSSVDTPAIPAPRWAKFHETDIPFIVVPPTSRTVQQGEPVFFNVVPADGYDPLFYQWYKDGAPIADGATGTGSTIYGSTTDELHLFNVSWFDQAAYSVVVSNAFGADTSAARTLTVIGPTGVRDTRPLSRAGNASSAIESAWPNPTRGEMSIALRLDDDSDVALRVFDASGRLVRHLPTSRLPAGLHCVLWDGRDERGARPASGVYWLRLERGGVSVESRRVVVLR